MSFTNIKLNQERGFTIVELLIVVVVIAILAAISIVSYTGITNRANASSAQSAASNVQKKIELYFADKGAYPHSKALLSGSGVTTEPFYLPSTSFGDAAPNNTSNSAQNGTKYVRLQACITGTSTTAPSATNINGIRLTWYDFEEPAASALKTIDMGDCSTATGRAIVNTAA